MSGVSATRPQASRDRVERLHQAIATVNDILLGKSHQVQLAFSCLLARGTC